MQKNKYWRLKPTESHNRTILFFCGKVFVKMKTICEMKWNCQVCVNGCRVDTLWQLSLMKDGQTDGHTDSLMTIYHYWLHTLHPHCVGVQWTRMIWKSSGYKINAHYLWPPDVQDYGIVWRSNVRIWNSIKLRFNEKTLSESIERNLTAFLI